MRTPLERYPSEETLKAVEEYFDGEELIALKKFIKGFIRDRRRRYAPIHKTEQNFICQ